MIHMVVPLAQHVGTGRSQEERPGPDVGMRPHMPKRRGIENERTVTPGVLDAEVGAAVLTSEQRELERPRGTESGRSSFRKRGGLGPGRSGQGFGIGGIAPSPAAGSGPETAVRRGNGGGFVRPLPGLCGALGRQFWVLVGSGVDARLLDPGRKGCGAKDGSRVAVAAPSAVAITTRM